MQSNPHDHVEEFEHIDADAVCEACSNVNPPGTLLCKVCGNNLRDQRVRRMQAGGPAEIETPRIQIRRIVGGVLAVVGLLAMVLFATKVDTIAGALMANSGSGDDASAPFSPESYWEGADAARFDPMLQILDENPMNIERASVQPPGAPLADLNGMYVLKRSNEETASVLGSAYIKKDGDNFDVVAVLSNGSEMRAVAEATSESMIQAYHVAVRNSDDTYDKGFGLARNDDTGVLFCSGFYGDPEQPVDFVALHVPDDIGATTTERPAETATAPAPATEPAAAPAAPAAVPAQQ